jgi:hypothetical protein
MATPGSVRTSVVVMEVGNGLGAFIRTVHRSEARRLPGWVGVGSARVDESVGVDEEAVFLEATAEDAVLRERGAAPGDELQAASTLVAMRRIAACRTSSPSPHYSSGPAVSRR